MHFFLQGSRGIGKSTMLREVLRPMTSMVAGFCTQRLLKSGNIAGYQAVLVNGELGPVDTAYSESAESVFLLRGKQNVPVLEQTIMQVERDVHRKEVKLILLDEIGGVELVSEQFMDCLNRILLSGKPCIGVFKCTENLAHTLAKMKGESPYRELHRSLEQLLTEKGQLMTLTKDNHQSVKSCLQDFVASVFKS